MKNIQSVHCRRCGNDDHDNNHKQREDNPNCATILYLLVDLKVLTVRLVADVCVATPRRDQHMHLADLISALRAFIGGGLAASNAGLASLFMSTIR